MTGSGFCSLVPTKHSQCDLFPNNCFRISNTTNEWCMNFGNKSCLDPCVRIGLCRSDASCCNTTTSLCGYKQCALSARASNNSRFAALCGGNAATGSGYCREYDTLRGNVPPAECFTVGLYCFQASANLYCVSASSSCNDGCKVGTNTCGPCCQGKESKQCHLLIAAGPFRKQR